MGNSLSATAISKASLPSAAYISDPSSIKSDTYSNFSVEEDSQATQACFPTVLRVTQV